MMFTSMTHKNDGAYLYALASFWAKKKEETLELIFNQVENPMEDIGRWYRLWIGVLSQAGDVKGLKSLSLHVDVCSTRIYPRSQLFLDLKNLIFWELGAFEWISTKKVSKYRLSEELRQKISWSKCQSLETSYIEKKVVQDFLDYFSYQVELRALLISGQWQRLEKTLKAMTKDLPQCPEQHLYPLFQHIDQEEPEKALLKSLTLSQTYPTPFYLLLTGYLASASGQYDQTIHLLEPFFEKTHDPDLLTTLAYAYSAKGDRVHSQRTYEKAKRKRTALGLPTLDIEEALSFLEGSEKGVVEQKKVEQKKVEQKKVEQKKVEQKKSWFVFLSSGASEEYHTSSDSSLDYLHRSVSKEMAKGDDVFLVFQSPSKKTRIHVLAWYKVYSQKSYHSLDGWKASLKLEAKFPERTYVHEKVLIQKTDHQKESIFEVQKNTAAQLKKRSTSIQEEREDSYVHKQSA